MARPSLLERDENGNFHPKVEAFFKCIQSGMTEDASASNAGLSREAIRTWKIQAKKDEEEGKEDSNFLAFMAKYKKSRSDCQKYLINTILKAATKYWQAAAWALERIFKGDFSAMTNAMNEEQSVQINLIKKDKNDSDGQ